jgi:hypothetical protein
MEIRLSIHTTAPLTGAAITGSGDSIHFEGWLELLRALATLTGAENYPVAEKLAARQHRLTSESGKVGRNECHDNGDVDGAG